MRSKDTIIIAIIIIMGYSTIAGAWISGLKIAADKYISGYNSRRDIWPELCGALWILLGPVTVVYILIHAYIGKNDVGKKKR